MKTRSNPFVRIAGAFVLGILVCPSYFFLVLLLSLAGIALVTSFVLLRQRASLGLEYCFSVALLLAFTSLGGLARQVAESRPANAVELAAGQEVLLDAVALEDARATRYGYKARVACTGAFAGKLMAYFPEEGAVIQQGQRLALRARIRPLGDSLGGYGDWLRHQGILATASCRTVAVTGQAEGWMARLHDLRRWLRARIRASIADPRMAGLATAMLLGDRAGLDPELRSDFGKAGLSHVLAISGLHVGIVFLFLSHLLSFLAISPRGARLRTFVVLALLVIYMLLTGASPAVCRAVLMLSLLEIGKTCFLQAKSLNLLATSAFVLLLIDPLLIFQPGFQLSYAAVSGILLFTHPLQLRLETAFPICKGRMASAIAVCLCAQAFTAPLVWLHFQQFPTYFLLSNLVLLPLISLSVMLGFAGLLTAWVPGIGHMLFGMLDFLLAVICMVSQRIAALPGAVVDEISLRSTPFLLLTGMCLVGTALIYWREIAVWIRQPGVPAFPRRSEIHVSGPQLRNVAGIAVAGLVLIATILIG